MTLRMIHTQIQTYVPHCEYKNFTDVASKDLTDLKNSPGHVKILRLVRYTRWDSTICL